MNFIFFFIANIFCSKYFLYKIRPHQEVLIYKTHQKDKNSIILRRVVGCQTCLDNHAQALKRLNGVFNPLCPSTYKAEENLYEVECINDIEECKNDAEETDEDQTHKSKSKFNLALFLTIYMCIIFIMCLGFYFHDSWIVKKFVSFLRWLVKQYVSLCRIIKRIFESREARERRIERERQENFTFSMHE